MLKSNLSLMLVLLLTISPISLFAQNQTGQKVIVNVDLAEFRVLVKYKKSGISIKDLKSENWRAYINCKEEDARKRAKRCKATKVKVNAQNLPPGAWFLFFDGSGTMMLKEIMQSARRALPQISKISRKEDMFALWTFAETATTIVPWTNDLNAINKGIQSIEASRTQNTLILDALYEALLEMEKVEGEYTKWIFLISDLKINPRMPARNLIQREGGAPCPASYMRWDSLHRDKCRPVEYEDITNMLLKLDVGLYIFDYSKHSGKNSESSVVQTDEFAKVVAVAEGRIFPVKNKKDAGRAFDELKKWLDIIYVVSFYTEVPPGKHRVKIDAGTVNDDGEFEPNKDWVVYAPIEFIIISR